MAVKKKSVTACFKDWPGSALDLQVTAVFEKYNGELIGSGTMLDTGERDVEYKVPVESISVLSQELIALGCVIL